MGEPRLVCADPHSPKLPQDITGPGWDPGWWDQPRSLLRRHSGCRWPRMVSDLLPAPPRRPQSVLLACRGVARGDARTAQPSAKPGSPAETTSHPSHAPACLNPDVARGGTCCAPSDAGSDGSERGTAGKPWAGLPSPVAPVSRQAHGSPGGFGAALLGADLCPSSHRCSPQASRPAWEPSSSSTRATSSSTSVSTRTARARSCRPPGSACPACTCAPWRHQPEPQGSPRGPAWPPPSHHAAPALEPTLPPLSPVSTPDAAASPLPDWPAGPPTAA